MTRLALCLLLLTTGAGADSLPYGVDTFHDDERGATCWYTATGLSCIPDSQLKRKTRAAGQQPAPVSPHETQPEPTPALAPGR
ncbi:hypothetical protein [Pseudomonas putida]|uniref:hypothetical protein n=1 Tax=Pseudomonas putida TaxID=303 RepID=UPI0009A17862|nr:hypothetical protein [Pseudomonas putida]